MKIYKEKKKKNKTKKVRTYCRTPNGSKRLIPPRKTPQNDGYVYINSLKYERRRVRRQRIAPTRRISRN
jgi:hypothetical protein